ncbi:MAG: acyl-CoA dehydrogenase family protein [Burkholderiaceae bacterium]|nr:acyl-CoA dehydrogenase family protein [Burkholderiaceae bacterium]MCD8564542.1 acyl-CoA dehydrogenase family protein [Burkholderiaceae bacterium]
MNMLEKLDSQRQWSDEEQMIIDSVRQLCTEKIAPRASDYDRTGEFPWDNVNNINELGLNGLFIPEQYGGSPLSYGCYIACVREISEACASTGIIWATNFHGIKPLIEFGNEEQKARLLPRIAAGGLGSLTITEPTAGSDATGMRTTFKDLGDEIEINGSKIFISNGDVADLYLVFGKWEGIEDPKKAITAVILEKGTPGLKVTGIEDKMGTRASSTASLAFDQCRIPKTNLLVGPGSGLEILLSSLNRSRPSVAAHALGIARAAFKDSIDYMNERRQFQKRLLEFQGMQFQTADLAAELLMCESWLWHVVDRVDRGDVDIGLEASVLKLRATDIAMRITTDAVQSLGGYGYCRDYRVERLMRDAKITQIWEGTNQIHRQLIGRSFLRKN